MTRRSEHTSWEPPAHAVDAGALVRYSWRTGTACGEHHEGECLRDIHHLWVWHDCSRILGADTVDPGLAYGWRASGVGLHTILQEEPLTLVASLYWPDCCGLHGWITDGRWVGV